MRPLMHGGWADALIAGSSKHEIDEPSRQEMLSSYARTK